MMATSMTASILFFGSITCPFLIRTSTVCDFASILNRRMMRKSACVFINRIYVKEFRVLLLPGSSLHEIFKFIHRERNKPWMFFHPLQKIFFDFFTPGSVDLPGRINTFFQFTDGKLITQLNKLSVDHDFLSKMGRNKYYAFFS